MKSVTSKVEPLTPGIPRAADVASRIVNIAAFLPGLAARQPDLPAIHFPAAGGGTDAEGQPAYAHCTYAELDGESDRIARGLTVLGVGRGVHTAMMVKPGRAFFELTFGLFKAGAVPVMIDPGIGLRHLKTCLAEARPEAFIGIPAAHAARRLLGWGRESVRTLVHVGGPSWLRGLLGGGVSLEQVKAAGDAAGADAHGSGAFVAATGGDDVAAILFTSGSTGVPKGVVYAHRHFVEQVEMIRDAYGIEPGEVDLPTFPLFALFDPALGMTTVIPRMDFTRPARVDPRHIVALVRRFGVTNMFGSPAVLNTVGRYGGPGGPGAGETLPTLRRVISAGAPVPGPVMERFLTMLGPDARVHTPYGATENLPVATIASDVLLGEAWAKTNEGAGVCVGLPVPPNDVRVIAITDDAIDRWELAVEVATGEVGEIVVLGPTTTEAYFGRDASTKLAKIPDERAPGAAPGRPRLRHRMGDVGYFDAQGRLWFCGRKAHRVRTPEGTLFTICCEAVFNTHPSVFRTALVGLGAPGAQRPLICVEREPGLKAPKWATLVSELRALGARHAHTAGIVDFLEHRGFPVDIRHNAKINRELLARWAEERV